MVMLGRMQRQEGALQQLVARKDSVKAQQLFGGAQQKYQQLVSGLPISGSVSLANAYRCYLPGLDSLQTSLQFLSLKGVALPAGQLQQLSELSAQIERLQGSLAVAGQAETYIRQREQLLKDQLMQYGWGKKLTGLNKEVVYYQQQLAVYKDMVSQRQQLEGAIIQTAGRLPAFRSFWQRYSMLAQLFPMPENYGTDAALTGLQTNAAVRHAVQQSLGIKSSPLSGPGEGPAVPEQYLQQAQQQISQLKDKALQAGVTNSDMTVPDFQPDAQKNRSFLQRIEYGLTMQNSPATNVLPAITDIGVVAGYRFSDKATAGVGLSYKLGLGSRIDHIVLSSQGLGLRSYAEYRASGSFWMVAGLEYNYLQAFSHLPDIRDLQAWQRSVLVGVSRKIPLGRARQASVQLLYDVLSRDNPGSQPLKFRVGWSLR